MRPAIGISVIFALVVRSVQSGPGHVSWSTRQVVPILALALSLIPPLTLTLTLTLTNTTVPTMILRRHVQAREPGRQLRRVDLRVERQGR